MEKRLNTFNLKVKVHIRPNGYDLTKTFVGRDRCGRCQGFRVWAKICNVQQPGGPVRTFEKVKENLLILAVTYKSVEKSVKKERTNRHTN